MLDQFVERRRGAGWRLQPGQAFNFSITAILVQKRRCEAIVVVKRVVNPSFEIGANIVLPPPREGGSWRL
jgi:hypothetical protein